MLYEVITGDDDVGRILIQGFCNTIKEADPLPGTLVFYNSGVKLAAEGSSVLPALKSLEESGIKLLLCGTCADYFRITSYNVCYTKLLRRDGEVFRFGLFLLRWMGCL